MIQVFLELLHVEQIWNIGGDVEMQCIYVDVYTLLLCLSCIDIATLEILIVLSPDQVLGSIILEYLVLFESFILA